MALLRRLLLRATIVGTGAAFIGRVVGLPRDGNLRASAPAPHPERQVQKRAREIEDRLVQVSTSPRIYEADDFLSDEECEHMMRMGAASLQPSLTIDKITGEYHPDKVRTNMQMYVTKEATLDDPILAGIARRMYMLARVPVGHGEQIQVGRYRVGEKYDCHFDSEVAVGVIRSATIIVYLTDVEAGGATIFPMGQMCAPLPMCCDDQPGSGPPVRLFHPKKRKAILFYSHDLDGSQSPHSLHGSCPVTAGEKWIIQGWFRSALYPESPHYKFDELDKNGDLNIDLSTPEPQEL